MALRKGSKIDRGYATVDTDGVNYREISEVMTEMGWTMNHSSARNYVLRAMKKFAAGFAEAHGIELTDEQVSAAATAPVFQSFMGEVLNAVEVERRSRTW